ncbi:hypothetical protein ACL2XP_24960 [Sodalis sp. RH21]|uniref:hypothetical protein n=1 Tax=unclassified Sodalis (in: enterobacteria) TaxID=2636512 RepID=UPI0039B453AA
MTTPVARLHIGSEQTTVDIATPGQAKITLVLKLGSHLISMTHFHHNPPTPGEIETAIMVIEDEIALIRHDVPAGAQLVSNDPHMRAIALLAGVAEKDELALSLEATERLFDRLARVINGRPASAEGIPEGGDFAATLLILREFMHHLQFERIEVQE